MATESPIRISEGTDRWRPLKQPPNMYKKPSSPEISIEGLGLFLKDQTLTKDLIPSRSESAPPSMEGSIAAMENIFISQRKKDINNEKQLSCAANGSLGLPRNSLPSHQEESEDDHSSDQTLSVEKVASLASSPSYDANQIPSLDGLSFSNPNTSRLQDFSHPQLIYPGTSHAYGSPSHFHHNPSTSEIQPIIYAPAATYMPQPGPYYHNLPPAGFVALQYNSTGAYGMNSGILPSYVSGYPQQASVPVAFDSASFPVHGYDMQNLLKYYDRVGVPLQLQPHFHGQYYQPQLRDSYGSYSHLNHQTPREGAGVGSHDSRREPQHHLGGGGYYDNSNFKRGNVPSHYYYGSPENVGPSRGGPAVQTKPVAEANFPGGRYDASKNNGQSWKDANFHSFLEELKSGKGQRLELADITGYVVEFSVDQHGSRFIQQKLETCSGEEKASVFKEVVPHASKLITDVFGNYVIQKLFEHGSPEQRMNLANQLEGQILPLSFQMYGCRVIQKALDVIDLDQKARLVRELDGHVLRCVRDQNGNHVIQKCIESIPTDRIHFIISSFRGQVATLSMHPYGCRVIQRFLEHCNDDIQTQFIVDEIMDSVCLLAQDQYGNYVTQHVLERGKPHERSQIIEKLAGSIVQLSQHKFASNVIEKCLEYSDSASRGVLIKEIIGDNGDKNDNLLIMMKDQYANYVIQRILEKCSNDHREVLLGQIRNHLTALKKYTYGKHIVTRFEQLYGEGL